MSVSCNSLRIADLLTLFDLPSVCQYINDLIYASELDCIFFQNARAMLDR